MIELTINSTKGRDIHSFGLETAKRWRLGKKQEDNGALIVIAVKDRRYTFVTGEGIEDTLPDLYCDGVAQRFFVPNFKRGDFATGVYQGTVAVARKIAGDAGVKLSGAPPQPKQGSRRSSRRGGFSCFWILVMFVMFGGVLGGRRRRGYGTWGGGGLLQGMLLGSMLGGLGRGLGGGSSWGGGGFGGGFGGGGGGSFGGGGCSGGW